MVWETFLLFWDTGLISTVRNCFEIGVAACLGWLRVKSQPHGGWSHLALYARSVWSFRLIVDSLMPVASAALRMLPKCSTARRRRAAS